MPRGVKVNTKLFRKLREARGLSQAMLGEKAGLTQVSLSRIENGHPATFETIGKAADVLGIDAVYLLESQIGDVLLEGAGNGKEAQEVEAIDLSDAAGTEYMGRVEAGEVEGYERNVKDKREKEILDMLQRLFPIVSKMRQYEPAEAARACLNWPSQERSKEAIEEMSDWLGQVAEEMRAMTTPGVLRAIGGKTNE